MLYITTPSSQQTDYFIWRPPIDCHFSIETPPVSPDATPKDTIAISSDPLLALQESHFEIPSTTTSMAPTLLQMQTDAAHGQLLRRPDPSPVQNVLHTTSDDSQKSAASSSSDHRMSSIELARCSRCHRSPSIDIRTGKNNMVQYGLNLWYCTRCASMVGLGDR